MIPFLRDEKGGGDDEVRSAGDKENEDIRSDLETERFKHRRV